MHEGHSTAAADPRSVPAAPPAARHVHAHRHPAHATAAGVARLRQVLFLTLGFAVVEAAGGWLTGSLALLSDAGHMLTDVGAVGLALFALWFSRRQAPSHLTWGYLRSEILAAVVNGVILCLITLAIFVEGVRRLMNPVEVAAPGMLGVALAGLVVNLLCLRILHAGSEHTLNERGAALHVLGDLLGSIGAVAAAVAIHLTGWTPVDALISFFIGGLILVSTGRLLRDAAYVLMEGTPAHLKVDEVMAAMKAVPNVIAVKDLHLWSVASHHAVLSAHLVVDPPTEEACARRETRRLLLDRFGIDHVTLEVESPADSPEEPPGREGRCRSFL